MSISLQPYGLSPQVSAILGILQEGIQEWLPCPPPGGLPEPGILNILDNLTWAWVGEGIKEWRDSHGFALRFSLLQGPYWWMQFLETWSHLLSLRGRPYLSPPHLRLSSLHGLRTSACGQSWEPSSQTVPTAKGLEIILAGG